MAAVAFFMTSICLPAFVSAQIFLRVTSTTPVQNSGSARAIDAIEITFNNDVSAGNLTTNSIAIFGSYRGYYSIGERRNTASNTIQIKPTKSFIDGESITLYLYNDFESDTQRRLEFPFRLAFRIRSKAGISYTGFEKEAIALDPGDQQPVKIAVADFDGDAFLDAAVVNSTSGTVTILRNNALDPAQPILSPVVSYEVINPLNPTFSALTPLDIAIADFNADNNLDLIVPYFNSNLAYVFWGNGDLSFDPLPIMANLSDTVQSYFIALQPSSVVVEDFDLDGRQDFAITSSASNNVILYQNDGLNDNGEIQFSRLRSPLLAQAGAFDLACADLNADGIVDFVTANSAAQNFSYFIRQIGGYGEEKTVSINFRPIAVALENIRGSRAPGSDAYFLELVALSSSAPIIGKAAGIASARSEIVVFDWDPDSSKYYLNQAIPLQSQAQNFAVADIDALPDGIPGGGDASLDVVFGDYSGGDVQFLPNGFDRFAEQPVLLQQAENPRSIAVADLNRDGVADVLIAEHTSNRLQVLKSLGVPPKLYSHDFGKVFVGDTARYQQSIVLDNTLPVEVTISWPDTVNFRITPARFALAPGAKQVLSIAFMPQDTLRYQVRALLHSEPNPAGSAPSQIVLTGNGIEVNLVVRPRELRFPVVRPGLIDTLSLHIQNTGNDSLLLQQLELVTAQPQAGFGFPTGPFTILPYDSLEIPVTFAPQDTGTFQNALRISSNDPRNRTLDIPLFGRSTRHAPIITSADTVYAAEDKSFQYTATVYDPDGEEVTIRFENLPSWIDSSRGPTIWGMPREGDADTTFRVIAAKEFIQSSLDVVVFVQPENDPPYFVDLNDTTIVENQELRMRVQAVDPEGAELELRALGMENLPGTPQFLHNGNNSAIFAWQPPFGAVGVYQITFEARETTGERPRSVQENVTIRVEKALPDLILTRLALSSGDIRLNQTATITAAFALQRAPITTGESFVLRLWVNEQIVAERVFDGILEPGFADSLQHDYQFERVGGYTIVARVDADDAIDEVDTENNEQSTEVSVSEGQLVVRPNPFTPNGDSFNDAVIFDLTRIAVSSPELTVYDVNGRVVRKVMPGSGLQIPWDGRDDSGREMLPGTYLYILRDANKTIARGYVVLAR